MKNWLSISLISLLALLALLYILFKDIMSKIVFTVGMDGASTGIKTWADAQNFLTGGGALTFKFVIGVTNSSWLNIKLRGLETRVYYQGQLIGNSGVAALKNIDINSGTFKQWIEPIDIAANKKTLGLLFSDLFKGKDPELTYTTEMRIYGIKYSYTDKVKIIETTLSSL